MFHKGDRVKLSQPGLAHLWQTKSNRADHRGTCIQSQRELPYAPGTHTVPVQWDHLKHPTRLNVLFLEAIPCPLKTC